MARPLRDGVDYFPFDVGMLRDPKVKLIKGEFGALGVLVLITIMSSAYEENGYYKEWSDDVCILVSDEVGCGCNFGTVAEIVKGCVRRSLFDEGVLNAFGVLTSAGIQRRFLRAASKRDDIQIFQEYWLLDINDRKDFPASMLNKIAFKSVKTPGNPVKTPGNPKSKAKQSKVKESKGKEITEGAPPVGDAPESSSRKSGKRERSPRFTPPTLDEVRDYCRNRSSPVDPVVFFEYFEAGEWIDSKGNPVRNWKQKLLTWETNSQKQSKPSGNPFYDILERGDLDDTQGNG